MICRESAPSLSYCRTCKSELFARLDAIQARGVPAESRAARALPKPRAARSARLPRNRALESLAYAHVREASYAQ